MSLPTTNFPLDFYREFLERVRSLQIETITYDDLFQNCDDRDYLSGHRKEYKAWRKSRNRRTKYLLIQHDVDMHPHLTEAMIDLEREYDVRSNIFIFAERWSGSNAHAPYPIDHSFLQQAERDGFPIGYHQNALQLANFDPSAATKRFEADVAELRKFYDIQYVVPHGGRGAIVDGTLMHNSDLDIPDSLKSNLRWVYNRYGLSFHHRVSDGGLRNCTDANRLEQLNLPETFLDSIRPGKRAFLLVHPQRWGPNTDPGQTPHLAAMPWYQQMCTRHGITHAILQHAPDQ